MTNRRELLAFLTDDLLAWWLNGTYDEHLREWWSTPDAVDTATETVHVFFQSLEEHGYVIVRGESHTVRERNTMSELEHRDRLLMILREAETTLTTASHAATVSEAGRSGLQSSLCLLVGGLAQVVGSLADEIEERGEKGTP